MSRPIEVRKATTDDVAALAVLWTELAESADLQPSGDSLRRRIESSLDPAGFTTLVAVEESKVVGFVTYTLELTNPLIDSPALRVSGMHVSNDDRRRGVGAALLQAVVTAADEAGATEISVSVPPEMRAANRYLAKLGFAPVLVRRATTIDALRDHLAPSQTRTRRAVLRARKAAKQPVTAVSRVLQPESR